MTTVSSATKEVTFGPGTGQPCAIIGERINPTGKSKLQESLRNGDLTLVRNSAKRQVESGAHILDVNVGTPGVNEVEMLAKAVQAVMEVADLPLCIDTANPDALAAALAVYKGKALINSVTGEEHSLSRVLPLVKQHGAAIVGMCQDDTGIPCTVEERFGIAKRIVDACAALGIPKEDVVIDCACLSAGADPTAPQVTLGTVKMVTDVLGVSTVLGASNVSFGLPGRKAVNAIFLGMAIGSGLTSAIVDPTVPEIVEAMTIADMLAGRDDFAMRYLMYYRKAHPAEPK